ncbi:MAG: heme lyase CcmF/NrfE family subunit [Chloroflexi bacterium]|nr:heme lyase CcmF/NrfE family subunit [Chloroflexota bacterium]
MADLGYIALLLAMVASAYGVVTSLIGGIRRDELLALSGRNALYAAAGLVTIATVALWYLLIANDFSIDYVASHSERALPLFYRFSALWGGQAGSLLLWGFMLAIYGAVMVSFIWRKEPRRGPYIVAILLAVQFFFLALNVFAANPFDRLWVLPDGSTTGAMFRPEGAALFVPADGSGLNPLLQNYWMVGHPVFLLLGYVGLTLPMAWAVASLISGQLDDGWAKSVRVWVMVPWIFLSIGILMGSQWAYMELGWGGFWAWDPVENASFIPWLTATALIHSIIIQQQRGMLKVWNVVLAFLSFWLVIIGTFITRSGIIDSVHAFALSEVGPLFLGFIIFTFFGFLALVWWRLPDLESDTELDSMLSRESAFLFVNVLFIVAAFVTLFGTIFPIISEAVTGDKIAVGPPWFNKVDGPIFLAILFLMAVGPLLGWRRTSPEMLKRNLAFPVAFAIAIFTLLLMMVTRRWVPLVSWAVSALVVGAIIWEFYRGARSRRKATGESWLTALARVMARNQRRYGGYIVHLGIVFIAVAATTTTSFQHNLKASLQIDESASLAGYTFTFIGLDQEPGPNHTSMVANVLVTKGNETVGVLRPRMNFYSAISGRDQGPTTEVGLHTNLREDVYIVFNGWESNGQLGAFEFFVNPMMLWMWLGGIVLVIGATFALWPIPKSAARRVRAPVVAQPAS